MKHFLASLVVLAAITPAATFASTALCGVPDPITSAVTPCGNGPIVSIATTWGANAVLVSAGTVVVDFRGKTDTCPLWMGFMGCVDIGHTAWYMAHVIGL
jgi:hypothetical protein